ncbi:MAG: Fe-S cluster assembly protein SufD, partial [Nitrosarchaeum sp.]
MSQTLAQINSRHVEEISTSRNEPDWLKQYRQSSLSIYDTLPLETSPLYNKYTDAKKMDPQQVSFSSTTTNTVPSFLQKRLHELEKETC